MTPSSHHPRSLAIDACIGLGLLMLAASGGWSVGGSPPNNLLASAVNNLGVTLLLLAMGMVWSPTISASQSTKKALGRLSIWLVLSMEAVALLGMRFNPLGSLAVAWWTARGWTKKTWTSPILVGVMVVMAWAWLGHWPTWWPSLLLALAGSLALRWVRTPAHHLLVGMTLLTLSCWCPEGPPLSASHPMVQWWADLVNSTPTIMTWAAIISMGAALPSSAGVHCQRDGALAGLVGIHGLAIALVLPWSGAVELGLPAAAIVMLTQWSYVGMAMGLWSFCHHASHAQGPRLWMAQVQAGLGRHAFLVGTFVVMVWRWWSPHAQLVTLLGSLMAGTIWALTFNQSEHPPNAS